MRYLLLLLAVLLWLFSSCKNPFDDYKAVTYPDTTVYIDQLTPQICEVRIRDSDSTQHTTDYWTDKLTGRLIYKMKDTPYKNSRIHGTQYKYDEEGDTLLIAHFENGIRVDSTVYYWPNGNPKHKFFYSGMKNGNILFEVQYHENGTKKTDVVMYEEGILSGAVDYYSSEPPYKVTETYYYREGELIGIKIYNDLYDELDRRRDYLLAEYRKDSARIADALFAQAGDGDAVDVPVYYIGTEQDALHDVGEPDNWDIMKIDPAFMLRYYKR
jgi:hypothetical protein